MAPSQNLMVDAEWSQKTIGSAISVTRKVIDDVLEDFPDSGYQQNPR